LTADEMRASLEAELAWRQEELAFFKNQLNNIPEQDKDKYRKSLVMILYSHLEGYFKISLQTYIQFINTQHLSRKDVISGLMVAGMDREFHAYENLDRKCDIFRRELPEDNRLHRFYRRVDFVEQIDALKEQPLNVEDSVIDTESNLWYIVLQKNMYKIGLPTDMFDEFQADIDALVNRRNSIAHGNARSGVSQREFDNWETKTNSILSDIARQLYSFANNAKYLQTPDR